VQQRLGGGVGVEVLGAGPEVDVGQVEDREEYRGAESRTLLRREQEHGADRRDDDRAEERGQDAPRVEAGQADAVGGAGVVGEETRDQKAADDEEHVDADESPRDRSHLEVEQHHQQHGDRAQAVASISAAR